MEILFIGTASSNETFAKYTNECKNYKPTIAGVRFDKNIAVGLSKYASVKVLSYFPLPSYPNSNRLFFKGWLEKVPNCNIKYVDFVNLPVLKDLTLILNILITTIMWLTKNRRIKEKVVVISALALPFLAPATIARWIFNVRIISIVTDLPEFAANYRVGKPGLKGAMLNVLNSFLKRLRLKVDGFVFLTKDMNDLVNQKEKPFVIIEGLYEENANAKTTIENSKENAIMYAGTLNEKYGVKQLVDSAIEFKDSGVELWIFGSGDYEKKIEELSLKYTHIKYFGSINPDLVFEYEKKATLLVNTRPSNEEYTKYSFPSKILEYMASGTPVLTTKLACIPEEYDEFLYYIEDESIEGISRKIHEVLSKDKDELNDIGEASRTFILERKSTDFQCNKLYEFILNILTHRIEG